MKNYRKIMQEMELEELQGYAEMLLPLSKAQIAALTHKELIEKLMEDDGDGFAEAWEAANEDYGEMMHPDEDDEEFFAHEDFDDD